MEPALFRVCESLSSLVFIYALFLNMHKRNYAVKASLCMYSFICAVKTSVNWLIFVFWFSQKQLDNVLV